MKSRLLIVALLVLGLAGNLVFGFILSDQIPKIWRHFALFATTLPFFLAYEIGRRDRRTS